jgi:hypothetical protein
LNGFSTRRLPRRNMMNMKRKTPLIFYSTRSIMRDDSPTMGLVQVWFE